MIDLDIVWSDPEKLCDENNQVYYKREWFIPVNYRNDFFRYWKGYKFKMFEKGYSVEKRNNYDWFLIETKTKKSDFIKLNKKLPSKIYNQDDTPLRNYKVNDTSGLKKWQVGAVSKLVSAIQKWGCAVDGSDVGIGKTYVACAVARELKLKILVVCPKAVRESWRKVVYEHFGMGDSCIEIINYELLRTGNPKSKVASYVRVGKSRRKRFKWKIPKRTLIIYDEAQKLKSYKTLNSKCCMAALKQGYKMLFCSATIAISPLELKTVGECICLFKGFKQYYEWARDHGCVPGRFGGLEFIRNKSSLLKLHNDIFINRGVRLLRDSVKDFPESQISANSYQLDDANTERVNLVYAEMQEELEKLDDIRKRDARRGGVIKLVALLRARQHTELFKVPILIESTLNGLENNMSVVIFCNFTETIHALSDRLKTKCIVNGEIPEKIRQQNIADFQADKERIVIINIAAGGSGLSLHDLHGNHPRLSLICPTYSAILMRQATGRVWRTGGKTKSVQEIIFIANTIEEEVCKSVNNKLHNLDLLNDGDLLDSKTKSILDIN